MRFLVRHPTVQRLTYVPPKSANTGLYERPDGLLPNLRSLEINEELHLFAHLCRPLNTGEIYIIVDEAYVSDHREKRTCTCRHIEWMTSVQVDGVRSNTFISPDGGEFDNCQNLWRTLTRWARSPAWGQSTEITQKSKAIRDGEEMSFDSRWFILYVSCSVAP